MVSDIEITLQAVVVNIVLISCCQSVPDVDINCGGGFFFDKRIQRCSQCSRGCPSSSPFWQCVCSTYRDIICASCPTNTSYNSELDACISSDFISCPTKTSTRCPENGICMRNAMMDMCICNSSPSTIGCDLMIPERERTCFVSTVKPSPPSPQDLISYRLDNTKTEADAALIGFIVAVCCIGLVVISVFVILVVGIACHNRVIMWQHRRALHRLRQERRQRDARRQAEAERRRRQEDSREDDTHAAGAATEQGENSAVHGNNGDLDNRGETVSEESID